MKTNTIKSMTLKSDNQKKKKKAKIKSHFILFIYFADFIFLFGVMQCIKTLVQSLFINQISPRSLFKVIIAIIKLDKTGKAHPPSLFTSMKENIEVHGSKKIFTWQRPYSIITQNERTGILYFEA